MSCVKQKDERKDFPRQLPARHPKSLALAWRWIFRPFRLLYPSSRMLPTITLAAAFGACSVCTLTHLPSRAKPQAASATGARLACAGRVERTQLALMRARAAFQVRAGRRCVFERAEHAPHIMSPSFPRRCVLKQPMVKTKISAQNRGCWAGIDNSHCGRFRSPPC